MKFKIISTYETKFNEYRIVYNGKYYTQINNSIIGWHDLLNGEFETKEQAEELILKAYRNETNSI